MEKLQRQIMELNYKVDRLSQVVERITKDITLNDDQIKRETRPVSNNNSTINHIQRQFSENITKNYPDIDTSSMITHKDILDDEKSNHNEKYENSNTQNEYGMSCELQVQRLTAQLTAAYHRIAALEEQLLAKRKR